MQSSYGVKDYYLLPPYFHTKHKAEYDERE